MDYRLMVQRRADLVAEADKLVNDGKANGAYPLVDEAAARYMAIVSEVNELRQQIEAEDKHRDLLLSVAGPTQAPSITLPSSAKPSILLHDRIEDDPKRGFRHMAEFGLAVRSASIPGGRFDSRMNYLAAPSDFSRETGDDSGAGYLVPPAFEQQIIDLVDDLENDLDVMNLMNPRPTSVNSVQLLVDETTVWSGNGIVANWRNEGSQMNPSKLITKARSVVLWEAYVFALATSELLEDVAGLNDRLTVESAEALKWLVSEAYVNGDGVGKPLGFFNSAALVSVAKESSQAAATINPTNVAKMYARLMSYDGAFWLGHRSIMPQLMLMSVGNQPVFLPPNGFISAPGGTLMGLPVYLSEHAQVLGTQGDLMLVSPKGYVARRRTDTPEFATSIHLYFDYNIQAFRWTFRFGGMPLLSAAVTPNHGTDTLSHFVALATRS